MGQTFGVEITSGIPNKKLNRGCMISRSTERLAGIESYQVRD